MFGLKEIGLALDSRDCVVLRERSRGEIEELHHPALAQVRGDEIRAFGQRAYRLVGKSKDVVAVFPGRVEDAKILGAYLKHVVPRGSPVRRRLWASVPTGAGMQALYNLRQCLEGSLRPRETVLVPELLAAAAGCGFAVLASEEDSQRARMVIHVGASQLAGGVFVDGALQGLVVRNGSWDQLVREVQENLKFRLGTTLGFNSYFKVVRSLARSFFDRSSSRGPAGKIADTGAPSQLAALSEEALPAEAPEHTTPLNLRGFNERGLIEVVVEDETVSRTIDTQLRGLLFGLEKVVFGCFARLRSDGHGEIASDLLSDRVQICGDIFFDTAQLSQHFVRLSRFRFESTNGHAVARGLRRILAATAAQKQGYRELARSIQDDNRFLASAV